MGMIRMKKEGKRRRRESRAFKLLRNIQKEMATPPRPTNLELKQT